MYFVYILQSEKTGKYYTGLARDIGRRLKEHNAGYVKPTRFGRPWKVVHSESVPNRIEARRREKFFKSGAGREYRDSILPA